MTSFSNSDAFKAVAQENRTAAQLSGFYERLSTGLRINRPADDQGGYQISTQLTSAQALYSVAYRNTNDEISRLNVAEGALNELYSIASRQKELAVQAANESYSSSQRKALHAEANQLTDEFNRIIDSTKYNGSKILDLSNERTVIQVGITGSDSSSRITNVIGDDLARYKGSGSYSTSVSYTTGAGHYGVTLGDVNGDSFLDIIAANNSAGGPGAVYLGNGNGTFAAGTTFTGGTGTGGGRTQVETVDVTGDGKLDIVSVSGATSSIYVLAGNGNGTFATGISYATSGSNAREFVHGDLDGDGDIDLITSDQSVQKMAVFLNNGDGTFQASVSSSLTISQGLSLADLNNDGHLDLVGGDPSNGRARIKLGNGNGTFGSEYSIMLSGGQTGDIVTGDFNYDGNVDIASADYDTNAGNTVSLLYGNGDGTFKSRVSFSVSSGPYTLKAGDMNGDGYTDLVSVPLTGGRDLRVLYNDGEGSFSTGASFTTNILTPYEVGIGDVNGDGVNDLVVQVDQYSTVWTQSATRTTATKHLDLMSTDGAEAAMDTVNELLTRLSKEIGKVGGALNRLEIASRVNQNAATNLSEAASKIRDVDVASDVAGMVKLQILQQTQTAILAQANQKTATVLKLLE